VIVTRFPERLSRATPAAALLALAAAAAPAGAAVGPPTARDSWTADVLAPVVARAAPNGRAEPVAALAPVAPINGGMTVLAVDAVRRATGPDGRLWARLLLPVRPNGTLGWVPADVLRFRRTRLRITIDQSDRRLTLFRSGRAVLRAPVAIGKPATPTPNGRFAVAELIRTNEPGAFLGPVVFALTAHSETLNEFAGGDGRVAVHGTSLPGLIGTRASHGCIRLRNRDAVRLLRVVRPGVPVTIRG
jgi:lipoprotein-anchoring transpeptidase ErfK/SrfK